MIVDTSVLIAILADEADATQFEKVLTDAGSASISSGSWIEFSTVLVRKFRVPDPERVLDAFQAAYGLIIVSVSDEHTRAAAAGYARYGRGTGHRARLNFGDCFAYALAKATSEKLLFKGDDFIHTDVMPAI